jgi:hypothetical protein
MAFKAPDGKIVAERMNSKREDVERGVRFHGRVLRTKLPAISITTAWWQGDEAGR